MNATFEKSSDGDCYRYPACNSVIARVCAKERPPTIEENAPTDTGSCDRSKNCFSH